MRITKRTNPSWHQVRDDWSVQDSEEAAKLGWNIFASAPSPLPGDDDPPFVVWRDDQSKLLEDDQAAHEVLRQLCDKGDPLGVRAADFLRRHSPKEYAKVFEC